MARSSKGKTPVKLEIKEEVEDSGELLETFEPSQESSNEASSSNVKGPRLFSVPQLSLSQMETCDWGQEYAKCERWNPIWDVMHNDIDNWPKGYNLSNNRILLEIVYVCQAVCNVHTFGHTIIF